MDGKSFWTAMGMKKKNYEKSRRKQFSLLILILILVHFIFFFFESLTKQIVNRKDKTKQKQWQKR